MSKQKAMSKPPMMEIRTQPQASVWVYASDEEKEIVEGMLAAERVSRPDEIVAIKGVFTNARGQRAVEFCYRKREDSKFRKHPDILRLEKIIEGLRFDQLRREVRKSIHRR